MKYVCVLLALGCLVTAVRAQWLEATIPLDSASVPWALCYNPQCNKVYCAASNIDKVAIIDGATNQVIATVNTGTTPWAHCYNTQNNRIYCANYNNASVTVIDGATNKVIDSVFSGNGPRAVCYNPHDTRSTARMTANPTSQ
jgi:YVTN family beta-propeller protein